MRLGKGHLLFPNSLSFLFFFGGGFEVRNRNFAFVPPGAKGNSSQEFFFFFFWFVGLHSPSHA